MVLSPAEKQKRYRERKKKVEQAAPDLATNYLRTPFVEAAGHHLQDLDIHWDSLGIEGPWFQDDSGPKTLLGQLEQDLATTGEEAFPNVPKNSLGRAEVMVGVLLDIAMLTAAAINEYKLNEINARIAEIEAADLSYPTAKAKALADIVALQEIKARLDGKTFRRSFREFSVKGSYSDK
jgi:hypothetical protein